MYRSFYNLRDEPFRLTPDPRFLHLSEPHRNGLSMLLECILFRKGLVMLTGPVGTGKTTLLHATLHILSDKNLTRTPVGSAFMFNPLLTRDEFWEAVLDEFEVPCESTSKPRRLAALHRMLLETQRDGGTSVLIIDEAQLLSAELLEEIRLLGNIDTHQGKLLQVVLTGQPELVTLVGRPEFRALQQRIAGRCHLRALSQAETRAYIAERLHTAGARDTSPFSGSSLDAIYRYTQGVPRLINLVCESCLQIGFQTQRRQVQPDIAEEAASSLGLVQPSQFIEKKHAFTNHSPETAKPRSAVDILIEAMKQGRAAARE